MKLAMAQMSMTADMAQNLEKSCRMIAAAKDCDLILFPEIQLTPFFPQYEADKLPSGLSRQSMLLRLEDAPVKRLQAAAKDAGIWASPNIYAEVAGKPYDLSLLLDDTGAMQGMAKMVHIHQAPQFFERDYYTPSDEGFRVFDTPFGRIGIVICFDRHLPESIRTCALRGADLVIIPTANLTTEPMELFAWELRVQAYQNTVCIAMCNRVGREADATFAGQSLVVDCDGSILAMADGTEQLLVQEIDLGKVAKARQNRPYLALRRPEFYEV